MERFSSFTPDSRYSGTSMSSLAKSITGISRYSKNLESEKEWLRRRLNEGTPRRSFRSSLTSHSQPQAQRAAGAATDLDEVRTSLLFELNHLRPTARDIPHDAVAPPSSEGSDTAHAPTDGVESDEGRGRECSAEGSPPCPMSSTAEAEHKAEINGSLRGAIVGSEPSREEQEERSDQSSYGASPSSRRAGSQVELSESYLLKLLAFKEDEIELLQGENQRLQESFVQSQSHVKQLRLEQVAHKSEFELQLDMAGRKVQELVRQEEELRRELEAAQVRIAELKETQDDYKRFVSNFEKKSENQDRERQEVSRKLDKKTVQFEDVLKQNLLLQKQEARLKSRLVEVEGSLLQENTKSNNLRLELEKQKNELEGENRKLSHHSKMLERRLSSLSIENQRLQTGMKQTLSQLVDEVQVDVFELNEMMIHYDALAKRCRYLEAYMESEMKMKESMISQHRAEQNKSHAEIADLERRLEAAELDLLKARDQISTMREESKMLVSAAEKRSHVLSEEVELHRDIGRERERKLSEMLAEVRKSAEKEISALRNDKFSLETTVHDLRETMEEERERRAAAEERLNLARRERRKEVREMEVLLSRSLQALTPQLDEIDAQIGKCGSDLEQGTWPINLFLLYLNMKDLDEISQKLLSVLLEVLTAATA
ncbi:hypothetical protein GUITHDRAFT_116858 [Guillardia theta CCMP2712]|uniref:Uncharacterized protein n=2 Tax=Guillardia theta TaxID=55529 RepID=L1IM65_GUITC|nr:hypothetical protein GUITHDRAFT_116858 [Guillardia theta CCMP2712]EKX36994.1 hypothetical protein GUITHDRAFT_116858 [Guillardia theta CCMP2712]|eukprot:XP_005823974.1 hypothetical protein GUITHDRAFT_116858 [Guillardia theta CCMP2712]